MRNKPAQYVYFMRQVGGVGPIKIGVTRVPERRLQDLSVWAPVPLELLATAPGDNRLEKFLHRQHAHLRSHREWFHPDAELLARIELVRDGVSIEEAFKAEKYSVRRDYANQFTGIAYRSAA